MKRSGKIVTETKGIPWGAGAASSALSPVGGSVVATLCGALACRDLHRWTRGCFTMPPDVPPETPWLLRRLLAWYDGLDGTKRGDDELEELREERGLRGAAFHQIETKKESAVLNLVPARPRVCALEFELPFVSLAGGPPRMMHAPALCSLRSRRLAEPKSRDRASGVAAG